MADKDAKKGGKPRNRTKSAIKATRVAKRRRIFNLRRDKAVKTNVKGITKAIAAKTDATKMLPDAFQAIDKAVKGGVLKMNTAARMKSKLARMVAGK